MARSLDVLAAVQVDARADTRVRAAESAASDTQQLPHDTPHISGLRVFLLPETGTADTGLRSALADLVGVVAGIGRAVAGSAAKTAKTTLHALLFAVAAASLVASGVSAWGISDVSFSGSAGAGPLHSYLVLDFGTASYAFDFQHSGAATGWDMLQSLDTAVPGLQITYSDFGGGAVYLDTVAFAGHPATGGGSTWWSYWFSGTGADWAFADTGAGARVLSDGSWDGWSFVESFTSTAEPPRVPLVPEPPALIALGGMVAAWAGVRRRA